MPFIQINLVAGRDPETIDRCIRAVARTVHETLGAPLNTVRVAVHEVPPAYWLVGDKTKQELDAPQQPG